MIAIKHLLYKILNNLPIDYCVYFSLLEYYIEISTTPS